MNRRETHQLAIERINRFINSSEFIVSTIVELKERLAMLRKSFEGFTEQHLKVIDGMERNEFKKQDELFRQIEDNHRISAASIQSRIHVLIEETTERVENQIYGATESMEQNLVRDTQPEQLRVAVESDVQRVRNNPFRTQNHRSFDLRNRLQNPINQNEKRCHNCFDSHAMHRCEYFLSMTIRQRRERVKQLNLCFNCFMPHEDQIQHVCRYGPCRRCAFGQRHNSLLCYAQSH